MSYGLEEKVLEQIRDVFAEFPLISLVVLYGSRAKGTHKRGSDIDLCFFGEGITQELLYKIDCRLDDLSLPYSFDLSLFDHLKNQELKEHIRRVGVVLYPLL